MLKWAVCTRGFGLRLTPTSNVSCDSVIHEPLLRSTLDRLYSEFNYPDSATDPIQIVRRYGRPDDREVVGFCAAALAFGRVASVLHSIERLLTIVGDHPAAYVRAFDPLRQRQAFAGLVHRWIAGPDIVALLWIIKQMIDRSGSIEGFFVEGDDPAASDITDALDSFSTRALQLDVTAVYGSLSRPTRGCAISSPSVGGSACKRLNLFCAGWCATMLDLGVWTRAARPARRPARYARHSCRACLRLTRYTSPGGRWLATSPHAEPARSADP